MMMFCMDQVPRRLLDLVVGSRDRGTQLMARSTG